MSIFERSGRRIHFIHIPKCCGTSIKQMLEDNDWILHPYPSVPEYLQNELHVEKKEMQSGFLNHVHRNIWSMWSMQRDYQFAIVRNPYDRILSKIKQIRREVGDFPLDGFLKDLFLHLNYAIPGTHSQGLGSANNHFRPQIDFIGPETCVFKMETDIDELMLDLKKEI